MAETNRINGLMGGMEMAVLKRLHRAFDPTCAYFLARTLADQKLHQVVLCDPQTQAPPTYMAEFADLEIVARNDNPEQPRKTVIENGE